MFALSSQTTPSLLPGRPPEGGSDSEWAHEGWAPAPPWTPGHPLGRGPGHLPFRLWFPTAPPALKQPSAPCPCSGRPQESAALSTGEDAPCLPGGPTLMSLASPKSPTLQMLPSPTRMFLAARSRWM